MSDTRKKQNTWMFRSPKGRKRALVNKVRPSSVPPDSNDDIFPDKQCSLSHDIAKKMYDFYYPVDYTIERIMKKFNMKYLEAREIVIWAYTKYDSDSNDFIEFRIKEESDCCRIWKVKELKRKKYES